MDLVQRDDGSVDRDEMVMIEVMVEHLDLDWWAGYRSELETRFQQDAIVVRALGVRML